MFLDYNMPHRILTYKLLGSLVILLIFSVTLLPLTQSVYAQTPTNTMDVSTKGIVSASSNFHGVVMWTIINGDKGTLIIQSPVGRAMVHVSISPSVACDSTMPICLFSTVTDAGNNGVFNVGDTSRFAFDLGAKKESVSLLTGVLAGFDVSFDLSKTWSKNTALLPVNSTGIANPASVYCVNHGGKLSMQTTPAGQTGICTFPNGSQCEEWSYLKGTCSPTAGVNSTSSGSINSTATNTPRHLTLSLNESVGISTKN